jgi:hypothetical protein
MSYESVTYVLNLLCYLCSEPAPVQDMGNTLGRTCRPWRVLVACMFTTIAQRNTPEHTKLNSTDLTEP